MKIKKVLVATAIVGSLSCAGTALAEVNGSNANETAKLKERITLCDILPMVCESTAGGGGGKEPDKPRLDEDTAI